MKYDVAKKLKVQLMKEFPHADKGVITVFVDALVLHNRKNHDYDGNNDTFKRAFGIIGAFANVWRKVMRLFSMIVKTNKPLVNESLETTAMDLFVHSAMLVEQIRWHKKNRKL